MTFRDAVGCLANQWLSTGLPSSQGLDDAAAQLEGFRESLAVRGLWHEPPTMLTATLDDGLGQGLAVIERFVNVIGMHSISLGLLQPPDAIVRACHQHNPDYLGMTILQFDSEDDLTCISKNLPIKTRIVAGGPVFTADPAFANRTGTHYAAKNVADFLQFMLGESS